MNSIEKALKVLGTFTGEKLELGLSEISESANLNVSSVHRIITTLVKAGYLKQAEKRGKYSIGIQLFRFVQASSHQQKIIEIANPYLKELNYQTEETTNLAIYDNYEAVYIDSVQSKYMLRTFTKIGNRVPLYCTGVGKIFLANLPEDQLKHYLQTHTLEPRTENTFTDPIELAERLKVIRKNDLAEDDEEMEKGTRCLAAPLRDGDGLAFAAVSIAGPVSRLTRVKIKEYQPLVKACGSKISQELGYKRSVLINA